MRRTMSRRGLLTVSAALVLVLTGVVAGGALAGRADRYAPLSISVTRYVVDPAGDDVWTDLTLATLGGIDVYARCSFVSHNPDTGTAQGALAFTMRNTTGHQIGVATNSVAGIAGESTGGGGAFIWLPAGIGDPVFFAGEIYSADYSPYGGGGVHTFAILDDQGVSGTGIAAWSATYNAADQSGRCVFTLQFSGHALK